MSEQVTRIGTVHYVTGDATNPPGDGPKVIAHVCNDLGRWGKGFVIPLGERHPKAKAQFFAWHRGGAVVGTAAEPRPFALGEVQFVQVADGLWVANMIGQHKVKPEGGVPPVRYEEIGRALTEVAKFAAEHGATVHMPRIGCGLAGGTWDQVGPLVEQGVAAAGVDAYVYDQPTGVVPPR
jgi:O-acetyl-ADP-ribose deacetylase (regulator of RNase III)